MPPTRLDSRAPLIPLLGVVALLVLWQFSFSLLEVPRVRLFEKVICERYYANELRTTVANGIEKEERCKVPAIQSELAMVAAYKLCFDGIPGVLLQARFLGHEQN